ncbi:MAG: 4Fe-4S dicluster domain-containing protein [Candidatus Aminicenantes bacterium]
MNNQKDYKKENTNSGISRREFLKQSKNIAFGIGAGGVLTHFFWLDNGIAAVPASEGYLLVDTKKCQGCMSCMMACTLVHEGATNPSLARIQVIQNPFLKWPDDVTVEQCRQCVEPACVEACPADALKADPEHRNVRTVDEEKCIGCLSCVEACPFTPSRAHWNFQEDHAQKCDLCARAPFWEYGGGPAGEQACVEVCPVGAIKFTSEIPEQKGDKGYKVNLRDQAWQWLGYPKD